MSELSVMDICFKDMKPSRIAFGAMLNAIDCQDVEIVSPLGRANFVKAVLENYLLPSSSIISTAEDEAHAHFWSGVNHAKKRLDIVLCNASHTNIMAIQRTRSSIP